jgi:hypothetical protein
MRPPISFSFIAFAVPADIDAMNRLGIYPQSIGKRAAPVKVLSL